jgi:hypothetical protein
MTTAKPAAIPSPHVDFSHAFTTPHRLTVCLPDSSDKTLLDVLPDYLRMSWSYDNLIKKPLAAFVVPRTEWEIHLKPVVDGHPMARSQWSRSEGWLPVLVNTCEDEQVFMQLEVVGGLTAAIIRIEISNHDIDPHRIELRCERPGGWKGYNPAWIQPGWDRDVLLAGWHDRADRMIIFAIGGEEYSVPTATSLCPTWNLAPAQTRVGWIIRPYNAYHAALPALRACDWAVEFEDGKAAWRSLIGKAAKVSIPDPGVQNAWFACLADCFVMRERVADGTVVASPGTEMYRAPNPFEPLIVSVLFDQLGLHNLAAGNSQMFLDQQGDDGNWADPKGWAHYMWGASGIKAWAAMEHYRLTEDIDYLAAVYPRMLLNSNWQETQRAKTRELVNGDRPLTYGLMPRGMGDGGLMNDDDLYGVFLTHNLLAVYANAQTVEAARILNRQEDLPELQRIHQVALSDLMQAIEQGAISEEGYRWIPGVPGKTSGSRWGALYAVFPCGILAPDHDLITGTIRKFESRISQGGLPIYTGWMKDGMWVAITLDNLAEVLLFRDEGDAAARYLYATLNHGTPLYTWCEERGPEPGSKDCSGDRQHLWTPVAVARFLRDALVMEDGQTLHLARGTARHWLEEGKKIGIKDAATHFGMVSFEIVSDLHNNKITASIDLPSHNRANAVLLHLRHPQSSSIKSVTVNGKLWTEFDRKKETITLNGLTGQIVVTTQY